MNIPRPRRSISSSRDPLAVAATRDTWAGGVESAIPDTSKDLVLVKGTMNVNEVVSHLKQKFKREVDVVLHNKDE
ncbi:hypothetical protein Tco_1040525 [Tanacetum coccineum]